MIEIDKQDRKKIRKELEVFLSQVITELRDAESNQPMYLYSQQQENGKVRFFTMEKEERFNQEYFFLGEIKRYQYFDMVAETMFRRFKTAYYDD